MGNKSCYENARRRMQSTISHLIDPTNTSQDDSRVNQHAIFHNKYPVQYQHRYDIIPVDIKQKPLVGSFLVPYYNVEILSEDFSREQECTICFERFYQQDIIARLDCLCIYHKKCLDEWSQRKRCCHLYMDKTMLTNVN